MAVNKELLISEKKLVRKRIEFAIQTFYDTPTQDGLTAIFEELVYAVVYNISFHVPVEILKDEMFYAIGLLPAVGYVYKAFTNTEELVKCTEESSVVVPVRKLFERVANDSLSGLALNLTDATRAVVFMNRENIKRILNMAFECIEAQQDDVKDFLKNEI